jgi:hypothetical protein
MGVRPLEVQLHVKFSRDHGTGLCQRAWMGVRPHATRGPIACEVKLPTAALGSASVPGCE